MTSMTTRAAARPRPAPQLRWRKIAGVTGTMAGATIVAGAFLPWVETFAGLVQIPGVRGGNGRALAAAGILLAAAGLYHVIRGGRWSRWLVGLGGFGALGFSSYLLIQLTATTRALRGDPMTLARGGAGLWVIAAGSLLAFGTLFLPSAPARAPAANPPATGSARRAGAIRQRIVSRAGDLESIGARRGLQIALGIAWLVDAALQFQPALFGPAFVRQMLVPAAVGNPAALASPALWADRLISHDVAAWNTTFALIQLAIALGMLWRPAVKAALAGSIAWALAVWWLGEGLGAVLTGRATPVTGAPGAVILYALIAVLAWPRRSPAPGPGGIAATGLLGSRWSRAAWLVLWGSFAFFVLQPAVRGPRSLHDTLAGNASGEPGWLAALDRATASAAGSHGLVISVVLAAVFVVIAAGIVIPAATRPVLLLAMVAGLACWVIGENFGGIATGMATDPNTGPLLVLLAAAYWPLHRWRACRHPRVGAGHPGRPHERPVVRRRTGQRAAGDRPAVDRVCGPAAVLAVNIGPHLTYAVPWLRCRGGTCCGQLRAQAALGADDTVSLGGSQAWRNRRGRRCRPC